MIRGPCRPLTLLVIQVNKSFFLRNRFRNCVKTALYLQETEIMIDLYVLSDTTYTHCEFVLRFHGRILRHPVLKCSWSLGGIEYCKNPCSQMNDAGNTLQKLNINYLIIYPLFNLSFIILCIIYLFSFLFSNFNFYSYSQRPFLFVIWRNSIVSC